jgi:hypothetical protein
MERHTEPHARALLLGAPEGVEHLVQFVLILEIVRDARPESRTHTDPCLRLSAWMTAAPPGWLFCIASRRSHQIQHDLLDLRFVAKDVDAGLV